MPLYPNPNKPEKTNRSTRDQDNKSSVNSILKKKARIRIMLGIVLIALSPTLNAQTPTDTELWAAGIFQMKMNEHFQIHVEGELRFNNNISSQQLGFTETGLKYTVNNYLAFKGNYRFIAKPNKNNRNRIALDAYFGWRKNTFPLSVKYRLRFQDTKENNTKRKFTYLRNEFTLKYKLSKIVDPYISYEVFYRLNKINQFSTTRVYFGLNWKLNKCMSLSTFYCIQNNVNIINPTKKNILGVLFFYKVVK